MAAKAGQGRPNPEMTERGGVMVAVERLLAHASESRGGALFVIGAAGLGKTTVLEEAIAVARQLRQSFPNFRLPYYTLVAALGQVSNVDEAHAVMNDAIAKFGEAFRILMRLPENELLEFRSGDREHLIDGFRKARLA